MLIEKIIYIKNCTQVRTQETLDKVVYLPNRKPGKFKMLPHTENGYKDGYWVSWTSRENQLKYLDNYYNKKTNYTKDGLSTLNYKILDSYSENNYHYLGVKL